MADTTPGEKALGWSRTSGWGREAGIPEGYDEQREAYYAKIRKPLNDNQFDGAPLRDDEAPLAQTEITDPRIKKHDPRIMTEDGPTWPEDVSDPMGERLRRMGASEEGPSPREAMKRLGFD